MSRELWPAHLEERDQQVCSCGHKNLSHGHGPTGTGTGGCGFCDCDGFQVVGAVAA